MNEFKIGKNKIGYISDNFQKHFGSMNFKETEPKLESRKLERSMSDSEILAEFNPQECELGDLLWVIQNPQKAKLLENGYANIFYIRDESNTLWAVYACWNSSLEYWNVNAYSVTDPDRWREGFQVFSRKFGAGTLGTLDSWSLDGEIIELRGKTYILKLKE